MQRMCMSVSTYLGTYHLFNSKIQQNLKKLLTVHQIHLYVCVQGLDVMIVAVSVLGGIALKTILSYFFHNWKLVILY
jgi:hypothetical protein